MKKSRTDVRPTAVESPRHLPLVDLLVDARTELFELAVRSGLKVLESMLEEDRTALCGPRYAHVADRQASRSGSVSSDVVLGGRKVVVRRPRVRAEGREVPLPTFQAMADDDPLNRRVVEQMLVGVATRRYARSLEPVPATMCSRGTSKSAVSRRFVAKTAAQLAAWQTASLEALDLVGLLIDGVHIGEHCLIVALGIAADGQKHALGLWDGSTENARVCQDLLANLQSRGLRTDRSLLVILDGAKALRKAVRATFGEAALVQRCQVHKMRNVLEYLSDSRSPVGAGDPAARVSGRRHEDRSAPAARSRPSARTGVSQRGGERPRRPRRDPHGADTQALAAAAALARDHECHRKLDQSHAADKAQRQALARGTDDAAVGRRRCARSREGLPSAEGVC